MQNRDFLASGYPAFRAAYPGLPILIRESESVSARAFKRLGKMSFLLWYICDMCLSLDYAYGYLEWKTYGKWIDSGTEARISLEGLEAAQVKERLTDFVQGASKA